MEHPDLIWHDQQEKILKRWSEIGSSYRYMHDKAYAHFNSKNMRFALPVIIISTVTGTANFAQGTFPTSWQPYVPLGIGLMNLTAGLITTIAQFLRVSELLEGHRAASIAYSKLSRNISVELSLPVSERVCCGKEFISNARLELDRLIEQSPNIPLFIVKEFCKKFDGTDFMKPEILDIRGVDVYKDEQLLRERLLKEGESRKAAEKVKKDDIRAQLVKEAKERDDDIKRQAEKLLGIEMQRLRVKENEHRQEKKDSVGLNSVANKMQDLISKLTAADQRGEMVTPPSSGRDSEEPSPKAHPPKDKHNLIIEITDVNDEDTYQSDESGETSDH
jgi:hypothetical protein